jgi:hypothetical protein
MFRTAVVALLITLFVPKQPGACDQPTAAAPPLCYEVQINGESFLVEANRVVKLESKEKPGVSYNVAVRVSPVQRVRLGGFQFEYEMPAKMQEDGKGENRSVRLTHELGFSILLADLGRPLEPKTQEETLKMLVEAVTKTLREQKAARIDVSDPRQRIFSGSHARGVTVGYRDSKDFGHICLVYVLSGPTFAASCVVEYLDHDADDVLPLIKKTLDSVQAIPGRR